MKLLTKELREKLPALYSQEIEKDPLAIVKFFPPWGSDAWYVIEFDGVDTFYGYAALDIPELRYFYLSEMEKIRGPMGLGIERDMHFRPTRLSELRKKHEGCG